MLRFRTFPKLFQTRDPEKMSCSVITPSNPLWDDEAFFDTGPLDISTDDFDEIGWSSGESWGLHQVEDMRSPELTSVKLEDEQYAFPVFVSPAHTPYATETKLPDDGFALDPGYVDPSDHNRAFGAMSSLSLGKRKLMVDAGSGFPNPPKRVFLHSSSTREGAVSAPMIGIYTPEARRERLKRFHEKRRRRVYQKRVKYSCRKTLADERPRVKGRFVKVLGAAVTSDNTGSEKAPKAVSRSNSYPSETRSRSPSPFRATISDDGGAAWSP